MPRRGIKSYEGGLAYRPRPGGNVRQLFFEVDGSVITGTDNDIQSGNVELQPFGIEFENGDRVQVELETSKEVLDEDFNIRPDDGIAIAAGDYSWQSARLELLSSDRRPWFVVARVTDGGFFDGRRTDWDASLSWRPNRYLTSTLEYIQNDVRLDDGDFTTRIGRVRANISFTPDLSWSNFVQYDNESDSVGLNSRMRWIPKPGTELFFVFNETWEDGDSFAPLTQQLAFKIEYTLRF